MKSFRIENIKSFVDSKEIEVKPLTVFVGRNSCGKSSLIRFPAVLAQTANADSDSPIKFYGKMVDYGNYEDVIHYGSLGEMSFELKYSVDVNISRRVLHSNDYVLGGMKGVVIEHNRIDDVREVTLRVTLNKLKKRISVEKVELLESGKCLYCICRSDNQRYTFYVNYVYQDGEFVENQFYMDIDDITFEKFIPCYDMYDAIKDIYRRETGKYISDEHLNYLFKFIYKRNTNIKDELSEDADENVLKRWRQFEYYADLTRNIFMIYENESKNIRYIGPFRENPSRIYRDPEYNSYGVGVHGENTSNELIRDYRRKDANLIVSISKWTKEVLGYEIVLREVTTGLFQIMLKNSNGIETNLIDNGYGISQVLPIVTEVIKLTTYMSSERMLKQSGDKILLLEQPELHLHPAAQSELADLFVNCILNGKGKKILIETHSEHLIRKLQVLIASRECALTKDMVRIYYVDKNEKGEAYVEEMKILENGKFETQWPSGFFDKGYILSRELAKAGIQID